ncbi:hypothetical protein [Fructobacillus tropaeoli]|uniref:hypothetical protein n=1 Tax=Fructobacillus tropaeoli TaxID=709323 RepID=UPI002DB14CFA|nr:unnamed protein product [Fructobacillus tropaeoli]
MLNKQINALKGHFEHADPRYAKHYIFTLPSKYRDNLEEVKKVFVPIYNNKGYNPIKSVPLMVDEWLTLDEEESQKHWSILGLRRSRNHAKKQK